MRCSHRPVSLFWVYFCVALTGFFLNVSISDILLFPSVNAESMEEFKMKGEWECEKRNTEGLCESWVLKNGKLVEKRRGCFPGDSLVFADADPQKVISAYSQHMISRSGFGCFHSAFGHGIKHMKDLNTGDYILSPPPPSRSSPKGDATTEEKRPTITRVIGWFHRDVDTLIPYWVLCSRIYPKNFIVPSLSPYFFSSYQTNEVGEKACLSATGNHIVFSSNGWKSVEEVIANADSLRGLYGWHTVTSVLKRQKKGMYAPITQNQRYYVGDPENVNQFYAVHSYAHGTAIAAGYHTETFEWLMKPLVNILYHIGFGWDQLLDIPRNQSGNNALNPFFHALEKYIRIPLDKSVCNNSSCSSISYSGCSCSSSSSCQVAGVGVTDTATNFMVDDGHNERKEEEKEAKSVYRHQ